MKQLERISSVAFFGVAKALSFPIAWQPILMDVLFPVLNSYRLILLIVIPANVTVNYV